MKGQQRFSAIIFGVAALISAALLLAPQHSMAAGAGGHASAEAGEIKEAPPSLPPDARFKADILVIVAHPDDETEIGSYLARAVFDEHKRVAAIYGTPGNGGGDSVSNAQAASLGDIRMIEAREALAYYGVMHVWFLGGTDTPGQDVLRSLETWNHARALWEAVRLVRLTRPEVVLTWLPDYVAGENHGDHQAAGVIATEAFDMAGDPSVFPEQLAAPRNRTGIGNLTEGLHPWQPKKIYYFSDAVNQDFMNGQEPEYKTTEISPSKHLPYYKLAAEEMSRHLTQGDTGQMATHAIETGDYTYFKQPERMILGKSLVQCSTTGDVFQGVTPGAIPFAPVHGYQPRARHGISIELGGPWAFYRVFWRVHNLDHLADLIKTPQVAVADSADVHVPILIHNDTGQPVQVTLTSTIPAGWKEVQGTARYPVRPHESYPAKALYVASSTEKPEWQTLTWKAESNGQTVGTLTLRVLTDTPGLPQ
ncbi:MAG TPA: PIG-L family deacetylase [Terriglobia bacterium]|nr:PIG-L family deacetylase [Terriglobia bacterium]